MRLLSLSIFAAFALAFVALASDSPPPTSVPTESPTIEARGHGGGRSGIFKRFRERRQERRGSGSCA